MSGSNKGSGGGHDRRTFLKRAAIALPSATVAGALGTTACSPDVGSEAASDASGVDSGLDKELLLSVAEVALPASTLGAAGLGQAVDRFRSWVGGFAPAAELDHGYLTGSLRYAAPHPGPRWAAQLEAMDIESRHRTGEGLRDRGADDRKALIEDVIRREAVTRLPGDPARADHVVVGLLAWFYGTPDANDLCYQANIGRHSCRGIVSLPEEPAAKEDLA